MSESGGSAKSEISSVCSVAPVAALTVAERAELLALMSSHFENVDAAQFFRDLDEKQSVVLLRDADTGRLTGFSTIMLLETTLAGQRLAAVFAGDTIVEPEYWGQSAWLYQWGECGFSLALDSQVERVGLLLLTSTHRSYRFLPGFFREYYPRPEQPTPADVRERLEALVRLKFPHEYDANTGIVSPHHRTPVRPQRSDPTAITSDDPHAEFFRTINPHFENGDFLACTAEFTWENLTPLGRRIVRGAV